jgi:hypothetical protein
MTLSTDPLSFVVCNKVRVLPDKRFLELGGEYSAKNRTFWYLDRAIDKETASCYAFKIGGIYSYIPKKMFSYSHNNEHLISTYFTSVLQPPYREYKDPRLVFNRHFEVVVTTGEDDETEVQ